MRTQILLLVTILMGLNTPVFAEDIIFVKEMPDWCEIEKEDGESIHADLGIMLEERNVLFGIPLSHKGTPQYVFYHEWHSGNWTDDWQVTHYLYVELDEEDIAELREIYPDIPEEPTLSFWEEIGGKLLVGTIVVLFVAGFIVWCKFEYKKNKGTGSEPL